MKRKVFSLILALAMAVSLFTVGASAASLSYSDTAGHWAESAIERWSGYGIVQGSNGRFDPNGRLTCAQLATILANLLHLPEASDAGFTDNLPGAWYYDAINRCAAVGILNGNSNGTVTPEAFIARERAMVMLARALGFAAERDNILGVYADGYEVSAYARGYVAALVNAGAVQGNCDNRLLPKNTITRAEMVTMLDRLVAHYAAEDGMSVNAKDGGLVLVSGKNVRVVSAPAGTRIVVADGATGLTVNEKPVADGQTYIVPSTVIGIIASGGIYTPPAQHTHTWNDGVVTTPATCTVAGVKTYTCTVCGETYTETIPATGHTPVGVAEKPATCTEAGHTAGTKCSVCEAILSGMEAIPTTGHTEVIDAAKAPTCTETGLTEGKHCSVCNEVLVAQTEIPAKGHSWNEGEITTAPTCESVGIKTYICTVCNATKTEDIEALGHDWNEPTVVYAANGNNGTKTYTCKRQGCTGTKTEDIDWKFYLSATSVNTVDMTVGEDYTAVFTLPNGDKSVNAASVKLTAKMQNVGSLGVTGVREHSVPINTGITGVTADLGTWLNNCYSFSGMTVNATIGGKACTYKFSACEDGKITATTDTEAARAAWQELTSHVTTSAQAGNDSYILVANGSTLQIGTELLKFEKPENLKLNNFNDIDALVKNVKDHVKLDTGVETFDGIKILIKAGTQLAVGQSVATLDQDVTVEVTADGVSVPANILSGLRNQVNSGANNKVLVMAAVQMFNELVGQMNGKTINVTIQTIQ